MYVGCDSTRGILAEFNMVIGWQLCKISIKITTKIDVPGRTKSTTTDTKIKSSDKTYQQGISSVDAGRVAAGGPGIPTGHLNHAQRVSLENVRAGAGFETHLPRKNLTR